MWYYLSFASKTEFLGACVVEAATPEDALTVTHERGINPGGEVMILPTPGNETPPFPKYKLLSKAQLGEGATLGELRAQGLAPPEDAVMIDAERQPMTGNPRGVYERMTVDELFEMCRAFELDRANATPEGCAFIDGRLALIADILRERALSRK